jgi:hypothetical protein
MTTLNLCDEVPAGSLDRQSFVGIPRFRRRPEASRFVIKL